MKISQLILSCFAIVTLAACTTPAEEDEISNNAVSEEEDIDLDEESREEESTDPVFDSEEEEFRKIESCLYIKDPEECRALIGYCALVDFYPITIEDGQCVLAAEPGEQLCTALELIHDTPTWVWVRFNEDGTHEAGLVPSILNYAYEWQYCSDGLDVPECFCDVGALLREAAENSDP